MTTKNYSIVGALVAVLFAINAQAQQVTTVTGDELAGTNSITADRIIILFRTDASNNPHC